MEYASDKNSFWLGCSEYCEYELVFAANENIDREPSADTQKECIYIRTGENRNMS